MKKHKTPGTVAALLPLLLLLLLSTGYLLAVGSPRSLSQPRLPSGPTVSVSPPAGALEVGDVFTVAVAVSEVDVPLSAFQFDLAYDPAVLGHLHTTADSFLEVNGRESVCPDAAPASGTIRFACASAGLGAGPTGGGALAVLTFQAIAEGRSSLLLAGVQLVDGARPPALLPATAVDGEVTIGDGVAPTATPTATAVPTATSEPSNPTLFLPVVRR